MPLIRSGRCDDCRRRKRKCDEIHPMCGNCAGRDIKCTYSNERSTFIHSHTSAEETSSVILASRSTNGTPPSPKKPNSGINHRIVLTVRSSREPPSGDGVFHTFRAVNNSSSIGKRPLTKKPADVTTYRLSPPPYTAATRLRSEFASVLSGSTTTGFHLRLLGSWFDACLVRIGHSAVLDASIACLVEGHKARYLLDPGAAREGRRRYGEALRLLRQELPMRGGEDVTVELVVGTKALMIYELLAGSEVTGWISHSYGSIKLLVAAGPQFCERGELERILFYATFAQAWQQALMADRPSVFDTPEWLAVKPIEDAEISPWIGERCFVVTKLARLTSLVRAVRRDAGDAVVVGKAISLAEELLRIDWHGDETHYSLPELVTTWRPSDAALVPFSFTWPDSAFHPVIGLNFLWLSRILLSGLCQTLIAHNAPLHWPRLADLRATERSCAHSIAMSTDYFAALAPYGCVVAVQNLQAAWGVYWRWREVGDGGGVDCEGMMEWLRRRGNEFMGYVNGGEMGAGGLALHTKRLMGG